MSDDQEYVEPDDQLSNHEEHQDKEATTTPDETKRLKDEISQIRDEEERITTVSSQDQNTRPRRGSYNKQETVYDPKAAAEADLRSIYVGNVDYSVTSTDLENFFKACGTIVRITLPWDKYNQTHKGYAYIEFKENDSVINAVQLSGTDLKGRAINIDPKRTNIARQPGMAVLGGRGGGRGGRGMVMGMPPSGYMPMMYPMMSMYNPAVMMSQRVPLAGRGRGRGGFPPRNSGLSTHRNYNPNNVRYSPY